MNQATSGAKDLGLNRVPGLWPNIEAYPTSVPTDASSSVLVHIVESSTEKAPTITAKATMQVTANAMHKPNHSGENLSTTERKSAKSNTILTQTEEKKLSPIEHAIAEYAMCGMDNNARASVLSHLHNLILNQPDAFIKMTFITDPKADYKKRVDTTHLETLYSLQNLGTYYQLTTPADSQSNTVLQHLPRGHGERAFWGLTTVKRAIRKVAIAPPPPPKHVEEPDIVIPAQTDTAQPIDTLPAIKINTRKKIRHRILLAIPFLRSVKANKTGHYTDITNTKRKHSPEFEKRSVIVASEPQGIGIMEYDDDVLHIGRLDQNGLLQGEGVARIPGHGVYVGTFVNGCAHGKGAFYFDNGDYFEGTYIDGLSHGHGQFTSNDGIRAISSEVVHGDFHNSKTIDLNLKSQQHTQSQTNQQAQLRGLENLDGASFVMDHIPAFLPQGEGYLRYRRADGGYTCFKVISYSDIRLHSLHQPCGAYSKLSSHGRSVGAGGSADAISRGGDQGGKKKS